jgi:heme-degrading monooxygenase HmoA/uncharacterized damage-inducible protein DinB
MIARTWDGVTEARRGDEYLEYVKRTGVADLRATEGNRGVYVLRSVEGERARFRVMSLWDSMDAVRRFAGSEPRRARYYPEDAKFLEKLDPSVDHYEVLLGPPNGLPGGEAAELADEIRRIGDGDAWHGPALGELLAGVSAERAAARPLPGAHTIWEIVLHVAAWTDVFRRRLEGQAVEEPEEGDYPPVGETSGRAWAEATARLSAAHDRLRGAVARLSPAQLEAKVPGRPYSARFQVGSAIRHVVYHSGQIGLLKKA